MYRDVGQVIYSNKNIVTQKRFKTFFLSFRDKYSVLYHKMQIT